jgi:hypothetical protein
VLDRRENFHLAIGYPSDVILAVERCPFDDETGRLEHRYAFGISWLTENRKQEENVASFGLTHARTVPVRSRSWPESSSEPSRRI